MSPSSVCRWSDTRRDGLYETGDLGLMGTEGAGNARTPVNLIATIATGIMGSVHGGGVDLKSGAVGGPGSGRNG